MKAPIPKALKERLTPAAQRLSGLIRDFEWTWTKAVVFSVGFSFAILISMAVIPSWWLYYADQRLDGWEPGIEVGARIAPLPHVFIDVGGWWKLVRIEDPMQRKQPGDVESKLVVAVGIGW